MKGKIIKGIGGFYYVHLYYCQDEKKSIYECKAKGSFRNMKIKPQVGDDVEIDILDEEKLLGNITQILERKNSLIRPAVANVDQAVIIFATKDPEPHYNLLDRFLIMMEAQEVNTLICINKCDLDEDENYREVIETYNSCGYEIFAISTKTGLGIDEFTEKLQGKTTVFAGPSGVGKSSLLNIIAPGIEAKTGSLSDKIKRGKHTTRHSELVCCRDDMYIMDTPGFTSLMVQEMEPENLKEYYNEFVKLQDKCRFNGCVHINEPDCAVKAALQEGQISKLRYDNYKLLYEELKSRKKW